MSTGTGSHNAASSSAGVLCSGSSLMQREASLMWGEDHTHLWVSGQMFSDSPSNNKGLTASPEDTLWIEGHPGDTHTQVVLNKLRRLYLTYVCVHICVCKCVCAYLCVHMCVCIFNHN